MCAESYFVGWNRYIFHFLNIKNENSNNFPLSESNLNKNYGKKIACGANYSDNSFVCSKLKVAVIDLIRKWFALQLMVFIIHAIAADASFVWILPMCWPSSHKLCLPQL